MIFLKRNLLIGLVLFCIQISLNAQVTANPKTIFSQADKLRYEDPDKAMVLYKEAKAIFIKNGDTINTINSLLKISNIYSNNADYSKSYDGYWDALILSNAISETKLKGKIYDGLSVLYSLFERHDKADLYFKTALKFKKEQIKKNELDASELVSTYHTMASYNREQGNYGIAQTYIDSCRIVLKRKGVSENHVPYTDTEQGIVWLYQNKPDEALKLLLATEEKFLKSNKTYLVIIYSFIGDVYLAKNNTAQSEYYYLKSLAISERYKSHRNFVPKVNQKLGDLYMSTGKEKLAYTYLQKSKDINDQLFGARSTINKSLLEIKDDFRNEIENQKKFKEQTRLKELEQESSILFLRNAILSFVIVFIIALSIGIVWFLRTRFKTKQIIQKQNQLLKEENNQQILEIKNKELTAIALQLIEKDELLFEIKNSITQINTKNKGIGLSPLISKIKINRKKDWSEFNARFTDVNKNFYNTLRQRFPSLTPGDHKVCALIKLNFTSKEIAHLLGISIESLHSSRYRLRKKMNLSKSDNLIDIIARL